MRGIETLVAHLLFTYKIENFFPFDPIGKRTEAEVTDANGKQFKVTKGAPQVILALANPTPELFQQAAAEVERQAEKGFRTLGVARTEDDGSWRFLGMLPLFDPPREDSRQSIETLREMGVDVALPITSIAYDRVEASEQPSQWDMKQVLVIAVGLVLANVVSWFGLYWLSNHHWHLDVAQTQTVIFAGVLIGSNLTLNLSRNRGWLWSTPLPGLPLATATLATQIAGLVIAALGIYVSPIGWAIALQVYAYLLMWCLINGLLKMGLYQLLDSGARSMMPQSRAVARLTASLG